jgi:hypothetical protein
MLIEMEERGEIRDGRPEKMVTGDDRFSTKLPDSISKNQSYKWQSMATVAEGKC